MSIGLILDYKASRNKPFTFDSSFLKYPLLLERSVDRGTLNEFFSGTMIPVQL